MKPSKDWQYCSKCRQEICLKKCIVETEKYKVNVCQNPYEGYLEKYVYKEEERIKINYHCPNDFSIIKVIEL